MENMHFTARDAVREGSPFHALPELRGLLVESLYAAAVTREAALPLARLTLQPGESVPLHVNDRPEGLYLVSGKARVRRGAGAARIEAPAAASFPAGVPHAATALGDRPAVFLLSSSRAGRPAAMQGVLHDPEADLAAFGNPNEIRGNDPLFRWIVAEAFETWLPVEPTKGRRLRMKYLLDPHRGTPDFVLGVAEVEPDTHYTIHSHEPAEFYHVLEGSGTIHVAGTAYRVSAGDTIYVPENVPHGIDTAHHRLRVHWVYAVEGIGANWVWRALEEIRTDP
jgi:quercetin dioxygenase-like cupin family protein